MGIPLARIQGEQRRRSLLRFLKDSIPNYKAGWVHEEICKTLEQFLDDIVNERSPRLMINIPPRHGKSEIATKRFPAWSMGKYPWMEFACTSYSADMAEEFSKDTRGLFRDEYYKGVFPKSEFGDSTKLSNWDVKGGGKYKAVGVGGSLTGAGCNCLIIDDPVKDWESAVSKTQRERIWNWYTSTAYTRLAPGGGILIIQTRWHDDDLSGRLIKKMKDGEGENWTVLDFPAIAIKDEKNRKKGEALHSDRYPLESLERIKKNVGKRTWSALYQQTPRIEGGNHIKGEWFNVIDQASVPKDLTWVRGWDLAVTAKKSSDNSAGIKGAFDKDGNLFLAGGISFKKEWPGAKRVMVQMGKMEKISVRVEDNAAFKIAVAELKESLHGHCKVQGTTVVTDKLSRAIRWINLAENGKVFLVNGLWIESFIEEWEAFDPIKDSSPDDKVDCVSIVYHAIKKQNRAGIM